MSSNQNQNHSQKKKKKRSLLQQYAKSLRPVGFINKGNTCYANSILQI